MSVQSGPTAGGQWAQGNQNVLVHGLAQGASVSVTFDGHHRRVPLRPAVIPVPAWTGSPARLMRASSGALPFVDRDGLLAGLDAWMADPQPFSTYLVGGRGGSGKTRLGVHLCQAVQRQGWVCGLLEDAAEQSAAEALAEVPTARLVVVDYAETRADQLATLLPALEAGASVEHPVRVLLLVRAAPNDQDWTTPLRGRGDWLDALLEATPEQVLDERPLTMDERAALFAATAAAFAQYDPHPARALPVPVPALEGPTFATALMVVVAAYLLVHDGQRLPTTRQKLLGALAEHEDRYWCSTSEKTSKKAGLGLDKDLRARIVALATLAGAGGEDEARDLLALLPDLDDASAERRGLLARWTRDLYPGPRWWNPLEPDLLGEHLVATHLSAYPGVLAGALQRGEPAALAQPLSLCARAAGDHPTLATAMAPVLTAALPDLCRAAVTQAGTYTDLASLLGTTTLAAALQRTVISITVDLAALSAAVDALPPRPDLILSPLALTLTHQLSITYQRLARTDPATHEPHLAASLNDYSNRLFELGRYPDALTAIEQAVDIDQRLAQTNPDIPKPDFAVSLNNYSTCLSELGRHPDALTAAEQAISIYELLAGADSDIDELSLAVCLNNYSNCLSELGRYPDAVEAAKQAVDIYQRLPPRADLDTHECTLAALLNNYSNHLSNAKHYPQALTAIEQATTIRRRLARANRSAYEPDLAASLNNLSNRLSENERYFDALPPIEQSITIYDRLAQANPTAYGPRLIGSLENYSSRLSELGLHPDARQAKEEAERLSRESRMA